MCPEPNFFNQSGELYNNCNDILKGQREFIPIEDLAISQVYNDGGFFSTNVFMLNTEENTISSQSTTEIASGAPLDSGDANLRFGRFVKREVFDTDPNAEQGVVITSNDNFNGDNHCPKTGPGEFLVMNFFRSDGQFDCGAIPTVLPYSALQNTGKVWSTIIADFNRDGLDDLFVNYLPGGGYRVFSFGDATTTNITGEMTASAEEKGLFLVDATAGDFDGDGELEIAGVQNDNGFIQLVILELSFDGDGEIKGFMPPIFISSTFFNMDFGIESGKTIGITSGDFDTSTPFVDELVIAATSSTESSEVSATMVALGLNLDTSCTPFACVDGDGCSCVNNLTQNRVDITQSVGINRPSTPIRLKTKKTLSRPDMAVLGVNSPLEEATFFNISVLDFPGEGSNPLDFNLISSEIFSDNGFVCLHDVTLVNFDPESESGADLMVAALLANSSSQDCSDIIVLGGNAGENDPRIVFYEINGSQLTQNSVVNIDGFTNGQELPVIKNITSYMNLEAGDLQGRSTLLGDPTRVVINNNLKPSVVIKSPPMHVTTLPPPLGTDNNVNPAESTVIGNIITAFPELFNAEFGINNTTGQTFNQNNTTGFTISNRQGSEAELSYVIPNEAAASEKYRASAEKVHNYSVSNKYDNYFDLIQGQTLEQRFEDEMMAVHNRQNIWSYPIIAPDGIDCSACATSETCPGLLGCASGQAPLVFNVSAPDIINVSSGNTVNLEWFQPPEVPGNALSYPWTLAQLQQQFPGFLPLSSTNPNIELAGAHDEPVSVSWTINNGNSSGYSSSAQHSFNSSFSAAGTMLIFRGLGEGLIASFNYNMSDAFSTLFEFENRATLSEGFTINQNVFPNTQEIQYPFRSYIFGQDTVVGTIQSNSSNDDSFPVTGPLFLGFEANPASTSDLGGAGSWWFDTYMSGNSDIALNLPAQWDWITDDGDPDDPKQFRFSTKLDSTNQFYYMKSFFAVPLGAQTSCPSSVPGSSEFSFGPQRATFQDGEQILLCLRVYNLSLNDFPADAQPKVRIYRREWDHNTGDFVLGSESILIEEINLSNIPKAGAENFGDQNASDAPNWVYAGAIFDTTDLASEGDKHFKFWAVTWIENSSGVLIDELSDLGLESIPSQDIISHENVIVEPFSNNVGVYNQVFVVTEDVGLFRGFPKDDPNSGPLPLSTTGVGDPVFIQSLNSIPSNVVPGDRAQLELVVNNFDALTHDVVLLYYEGDPDAGGRLFDMEIIPRIPSEDTFKVKNTFLPRSCGNHLIFVKMIGDDGSSDLALANVSRDCALVSISEAVYTPSLSQLMVSGTAQGLIRGSDVELFDVRDLNNPISILSENDLGSNNGQRTFKFTINDLSEDQAPCIVRVESGQTLDQSQVVGVEGCGGDPEFPGVQDPPIIGPEPSPGPSPTPIPGFPPIDPNGDNVADVGGVFIVSPEGTMLQEAAQVLPECPDELNGELIDYPLDFFTFEVSNISVGETISVNFFLPEGTESIDKFFKFGPTPDNPEPHCYEFNFDGVTGAQFLPNGEIMITFVDGLRGDSDLTANGVITDPGGPAIVRNTPEGPSQIGVGDCSLARTSQPPSALISLMIPLLAGLFAGVRLLRNRRSLISK